MKKVWICVALGLMGLGVALFVGLGIMVDFDYMRLDSMKYVTNSYDITDDFHSIDIETITADVELRLAEDGKCRVVCYEWEKVLHDVGVKDATLFVDAKDTRSWLDHLTIFNFGTPSVTVYLPEGEYQSLKVDNTTGDLKLSGSWSMEKLGLEVTTGDIFIDGVTCRGDAEFHATTGKTTVKNACVSKKLQLRWTTGDVLMEDCGIGELSLDGTTGDAALKDVIVAGSLRAEVTTGDVKLERCDAGELFLKATTGDITASLLTEKRISADANTGKVDVPQHTTGGQCEIRTTTGDITVRIG